MEPIKMKKTLITTIGLSAIISYMGLKDSLSDVGFITQISDNNEISGGKYQKKLPPKNLTDTGNTKTDRRQSDKSHLQRYLKNKNRFDFNEDQFFSSLAQESDLWKKENEKIMKSLYEDVPYNYQFTSKTKIRQRVRKIIFLEKLYKKLNNEELKIITNTIFKTYSKMIKKGIRKYAL